MGNRVGYDERGRRNAASSSNGKAAYVDVGRVFDSCSDRDCVEDLRVYFTACDQDLLERANTVRGKKAKVLGTCIDVEELPFRDGYYTCKLTFYIEVQIEAIIGDQCKVLRGVTAFEKKVALYGGEGSVQVFCGDLHETCSDPCDNVMSSSNTPRCCVQVAEPVLLDTHVNDACGRGCSMCCCGCESFPQTIASCFDGCLVSADAGKTLTVTIGLFTIVQLVRNTQMLIPVYNYAVPCKECNCDEDTPCELFRKMAFPMEEFFPPHCKEDRK